MYSFNGTRILCSSYQVFSNTCSEISKLTKLKCSILCLWYRFQNKLLYCQRNILSFENVVKQQDEMNGLNIFWQLLLIILNWYIIIILEGFIFFNGVCFKSS